MNNNISKRQYGHIIMERVICSKCNESCLICKDNTSSCCSAPISSKIEGSISKETHTEMKRKAPKNKDKIMILEEQGNKCYWCGREFGTEVIRPDGTKTILQPIWDHYICYSYSNDSTGNNFVASCMRCNSHKSSLVISDNETEANIR